MKSGIYSIKHLESGKIYIGQSEDIDRRIKAHKNWFANPTRVINRHLYNYAKKYGADAFEFCVVEYCDIENLDERELYWFEQHKDNSFNVRPEPVSNRGIKRTEEFCKENSERAFKRFQNPKNLESHRNSMKKRSKNPEWIEKNRQAAKKRAEDPNWRSKMKDIVNNENRINSIKIKNFTTGYSKCVACYDKSGLLVDYFLNVADAGRALNILRSNISSCINGKLASAYGYTWRYISNEEYLNLNGGDILKR